jgi:hypothetical protein
MCIGSVPEISQEIVNENLPESNNDNKVRVVNFTTKILLFKSTVFPHGNNKYILGLLLTEKRKI